MDTSIEFDGVLTRPCTKHLIFSFIKYILYQRGQIPFQLDSLRKYAESAADEVVHDLSDEVEKMDWCCGADSIRHHQQLLVCSHSPLVSSASWVRKCPIVNGFAQNWNLIFKGSVLHVHKCVELR